MKDAHGLSLQVVWLSLAVLLSACFAGPKPATLYTLQPIAREQLALQTGQFTAMTLIMPVRLAPQLQNRSLIIRSTATAARATTTHVWAGPLDQQIGETVAAELKMLLETDNIAVYPGPRYGVTRYQVELEIADFTGDEQSFTLDAVYTLSDTTNKTVLARKSFRKVLHIDKPELSGYVAAASQALSDLSSEVAATLLRLHNPQSPPVTTYEQ